MLIYGFNSDTAYTTATADYTKCTLLFTKGQASLVTHSGAGLIYNTNIFRYVHLIMTSSCARHTINSLQI